MSDNSQRGRGHSARRSCVGIGDSIINYGAPTWTATNRDLSDRGWVNWCLAYLKGRLRLLGYYGSGGIDMDRIIEIMRDDVLTLDLRPGYAFTVLGGTDILRGDLPIQVIPKIKDFYRMCARAGITVIDCTNGPSTAINTDLLRKHMHEINTWKKQYVQENDNVFLVDAQSLIIDGSDSSGNPASGMTIDGTHFTSAGCQRVGLAAYNILDSIVPYHDPLITSFNDMASLGEYGNLVTNPTFIGTSGTNSGTGASGSVADSWIHAVSGAITSVASKVARSGDDLGAWQRLTISSAGAASSASMFQSVTSNITVGHTIFGNVEIQTQAAFTEIASIQLEIICRDGSNALASAYSMSQGDGTVNAYGNVVLQTFPLVVPAGTTEIYYTIRVQVDSGASAGATTVDIGRCQLRRLYSPA